jgi:hypothetical protein
VLRFREVPVTTQPALDLSLYPASYRVSKGYGAFFSFIGAIPILGGSVGIWYFATGHEMRSPGQALFMAAICLAFVLLGVLLIASILRSTVTLLPDAIIIQGIFSSRTLLRSQIAGRRVLPTQYVSTLALIPHSSHQKKLKIPLMFRSDPAFDAWFAAIPDLDAKELAQSQADLDADPDLGFHSEDRKQRVAQAKDTAKYLNVISWIALVWGFFFPRPYPLAIAVLAVLPIVAVVLLLRSRGIYQIEGRRNDRRPSLAVPFIFPGMVLVLRTTVDLHLLHWASLLTASAICTLVLTVILVSSDPGLRKRPWTALIILFLGVFYFYGAIAEVNSLLDRASPQTYEVAVTGKHIVSGKSTSYHLELEPWGPLTKPDNVTVPSPLYYYTAPGNTVCVDLYPGTLHIPWYLVRTCR